MITQELLDEIMTSDEWPCTSNEWIFSRFDELPETLLHWFACDCAQENLEREEKHGLQRPIRQWNALSTKRKWVLGEVEDEEVEFIRKIAGQGIGTTAAEIRRVGRHVARDTALASLVSVMDHFATARAYALPASWQQRHFRYLVTVWQSCGERAPMLLAEGKCPIDKEVA